MSVYHSYILYVIDAVSGKNIHVSIGVVLAWCCYFYYLRMTTVSISSVAVFFFFYVESAAPSRRCESRAVFFPSAISATTRRISPGGASVRTPAWSKCVLVAL